MLVKNCYDYLNSYPRNFAYYNLDLRVCEILQIVFEIQYFLNQNLRMESACHIDTAKALYIQRGNIFFTKYRGHFVRGQEVAICFRQTTINLEVFSFFFNLVTSDVLPKSFNNKAPKKKKRTIRNRDSIDISSTIL